MEKRILVFGVVLVVGLGLYYAGSPSFGGALVANVQAVDLATLAALIAMGIVSILIFQGAKQV